MKPGERYFSAVCETQVVVVRPAAGEVVLRCGGAPMTTTAPDTTGAPAPGLDGGAALGKRYVDEQTGLELLVSKAGAGTLEADDRPLSPKQAKPLPSSD